jgi:hypothetical protein
MNPTPFTSVPRPLWLRFVRSLVIIGLCLALTVITALAVGGYLPHVRNTFEQLFASGSSIPKVALGVTALFVVLLPLIVLAVAERRRWLTWPVLAAAWLVVLPVLAWLSWDDTAIRQPIMIEEFSPAFAGAEKSYAVLMQYSKQTPSAEAKVFEKTKMAAVWNASASNREPAKWIEFVTKNRAAIEADWETLAPQRRWFGELAAFDQIGDLTVADYNANIMSFQVWRTLSQRTCATATLLALDGHGDEAIARLAPLLEVGRKLQLSSRSLIRTMVAVVVERMCIETAGIVLDKAPASAVRRACLTTALGQENAPALARRLLMVEYVVFSPLFNRMKLGDTIAAARGTSFPLRRPLNFLSGLFFNPIATTNLYGDRVRELADLAEARELGKFNVRGQDYSNVLVTQSGMKNIGGRLMLSMAVPAFNKVVESHWKTADLRVALRTRLAAAGAN